MKNILVRHGGRALITLGVLAWLAGPAQAQFVLYDSFASGIIDPANWQGFSNEGTFGGPTDEVLRVVDENNALRLKLVSWGDNASDSGSVRSRQGLNIRQLGTLGGSGFITGLKVKVTVLNADAQHCPANLDTSAPPSLARAQLNATFFNDGNGGTNDRTGDVLGIFELQKRRNGSTAVHATVNRCPNATCSPGSVPIAVAGNPATFATTWSLNAPLALKVLWNQVNGEIKFVATNPSTPATETVNIVYQGTVTDVGPPISDVKSVRLLNDVENCSASRKSTVMDALFDAVKVKRAP